MRRRMLFLCLGAVLAGCSTGAGAGPTGAASSIAAAVAASGGPTAGPPATATSEPPASAAVRQVLETGEAVWNVLAVGKTIWVEGNEHLIQLDASTGRKLRTLDGVSATVSGDSLWYVRGRKLVQADAADGTEVAVFSPPTLGTRVVDGVAWTASEDTSVLTGFDLEKHTVVHEVKLPAGEPKWVEPWERSLWVVIDGSGGVVVRVDPTTGEILRDDIDAGYRPHSVVVGFGSLWVTDHGKAQVFRIGPDGGEQARIQGPGMNVAITASDESIWAAGPESLFEIDPASNAIVGKTPIGSGEWYGVAYSAGFLWLTSGDSGKLVQIEPQR